jgi:O-antigen ligase
MTSSVKRRINFFIVVAVLSLAVMLAILTQRVSLPTLLVAFVTSGGILILLRKPELGPPLLVAIAYLVPLEVNVSYTVAINAVVLMLPVLIIIWLLAQMRGNKIELRESRAFLPLAAFVTVAGLAWLVGNIIWDNRYPQPDNLVMVQLGQWSIILLSAAAFFFAAQQPLRALRWAIYVFVVLGVLALLGKYGGDLANAAFYSTFSRRAVTNGSFFVWLTALAGGLAAFDQKLPPSVRWLLLILTLSIPVLGLAQNQEWASSWLPPVVVIGILIWLWVERRNSGLALAMLAPLPLIILAFWQIYALNEESVSVLGRTILWESIISLALDNPILGLGLTTYRHYHKFIPLPTGFGGIWFAPNVNSHNIFIDIFAQMGIVGLAVFFWFIGRVALIGWRIRKLFNGFRNGYVAAMLAGLAGSLFASALVDWFLPFVYNAGFPGFRFSVLGWMFLGGLIVVAHQEKADAAATDSTSVQHDALTKKPQEVYPPIEGII